MDIKLALLRPLEETLRDIYRQGDAAQKGQSTTAGRRKQRPSSKMLLAPSNLHMILSKSCKSHAIYKRWAQNVAKTVQFTTQLLAATPCKHRATLCVNKMCTVQIIFSTCCKYHSTSSFDLQKSQSSIQFADAISKCCKRHAVFEW